MEPSPVPEADDIDCIRRQIGRSPREVRAVESRCRWGYPVVISVRPVLQGKRGKEPFPSYLWLTCPILVEQISRIEAAGGVKSLGQEIEAQPDRVAALAEDHRRLAAERSASLTAGDREAATTGGFLRELEETGIGGTRLESSGGALKCLHAHYGYHRARGGIVGTLLEASHRLRECTKAEVDRSPCAEPNGSQSIPADSARGLLP